MGDEYKSLEERWGTERRAGERRKPKSAQLTLDMAKTPNGGRRKGAGSPKTLRPKVRHRIRAAHAKGTPVHITLRRVADLADLRFPLVHDEIVRCIEASQREDFRVVHYSVQSDHIHLIVEADALALERGMRGLTIRTAKRLNRDVLKRTGKVWADRFHRHDLRTPTEVRNALVYVLANGVEHRPMLIGALIRGAKRPRRSRLAR